MAGTAEQLLALDRAVRRFKENSARWGAVAANGVRFSLIPTEDVNALLDAIADIEAEGGKD